MALWILDTSVPIAELPAAIEGDLGISVVAVAELQFGVLAAPEDERRAHRLARLGSILRNFEQLPVDAATHRAGRKGTARSPDLMIAATAHAHGARLVTTNVDDVDHLSRLIEIVPVLPGP